MKKTLFVMPALLVVTLSAPAAAGRTVTGGTTGFEAVAKGVISVSFDNMLLIRYHTVTPDGGDPTSTLRAVYFPFFHLRYFLKRNLSLSLGGSYFYEKNAVKAGATELSNIVDRGLIVDLMGNYHIRLGHSIFFKPGIGAGFFMGNREVPATGNLVSKTELMGGIARVDLGFEYFVNRHFSLRAGFDVMMRFGGEKQEDSDADSDSVFTADTGVNFGLAYSF